MFFSVFNYYKKEIKKERLKKSATKNIVKLTKSLAGSVSSVSLCENLKVVLCNT
jgi:hypothetical protein